MIKTETIIEKKEIQKAVSIQCDRCKKEYDIEDIFEIQEFHHIRFTGGYKSSFGDTTKVECDLCQHCLRALIGEICFYDGMEAEDLKNL